MVIYEVTATVQTANAPGYERYMREEHVPAIMATGCFRAAALSRADEGRYRACYEASSTQDLERYLAGYAPALREDFAAHFPEGVTVSREVWEVLQGWDRDGSSPCAGS
jgi:hypothetical protein